MAGDVALPALIRIAFSEEEFRALLEVAKADGTTLPAVVRKLVDAGLRARETDEAVA